MTNEQLEMLNEFRNLYAHELGDLSNQRVLMFLLEKAVQFKKKKLGLIQTKSKSSDNAPLPRAPKVKKQRAPITIKVKRQVWKRANACCEHLDVKSKERCSSKFALETDHIVSIALGGTNDLDNLQLLCRAHNSRRSVKTFGIHEISKR
ncbi:HNH endonuclease [compost metagenome]